jgi:hypothetical protein
MHTKDTPDYAMTVARMVQGQSQDLSTIEQWPYPWRLLADVAIQALAHGELPAPVVDRAIGQLNGDGAEIRAQFYEAVKKLFAGPRDNATESLPKMPDIPPLPSYARLPEDLGRDASPWLDRYIEFSREWSPRAFDGFHEACGLWVLATVAARRVMLPLGSKMYTPLSILLVARTSLWAKSTTARIAIETLTAAGLDWLLAADASSPQKFIQDLTPRLPSDFDKLPPRQQQRIRKRLAFAGQRGWFYEEFGQQVHSMNRSDGPMAEFRGIIRRFDDCYESYEYATIARGTDYVERPYIALLGNLTPADLRPFATRGAAMWNDGFWARFGFVAPYGVESGRGRFPAGERVIPPDLWKPLREWHEWLGVPQAMMNTEASPGGSAPALFSVVDPTRCTLGHGVMDAFYRYSDGLRDILMESGTQDFDGNYARFPEKAMRIAMLLASSGNRRQIEMTHWARAQQITERWRIGLHALYEEINEPEPSRAEMMEGKVLRAIEKHGKRTAAQVANDVRGLDTGTAETLLQKLVKEEVLVAEKAQRTTYYTFPKEEA